MRVFTSSAQTVSRRVRVVAAPRFAAWLGPALVGLLLTLPVSHDTWDDAAITLGYARTLAETGQVRFGHFGERVEGFSSPLWMLVCAGLALIWRGPDDLLLAAKLLAGLLYLANAGLICALVRRCAGAGAGRAAAWLYGTAAIAIVSIPDAMENHLFLSLHLLLALTYLRLRDGVTRPWACTAGLGLLLALLVICRPEGVLTCAAFGAAFALEWRRLAAPARSAALCGGALATILVLCFAIWRVVYFGSPLPNTVYAKMWPPYAAAFWPRVRTGLVAFAIFAAAAWLWLPVAAWGRTRLPCFARALPAAIRAWPFFSLTLAAFLVYQLLIGMQMGTLNRLLLPVFPFAWLLALAALARSAARPGPVRIALCAATVLVAQGYAYAAYWRNPITIDCVRLLVEPGIRLALIMEEQTPDAAQPTPQPPDAGAVAAHGSAGTRFARRAPAVALADVGAALLYWGDRVRIVDLALLNNRAAAQGGWGEVERSLVRDTPPDVLATHTIWTGLAALDRSEFVLNEYVQVTVDGRFYQVRRAPLEALRAAPPPGLVIQAAANLSPDEVERMRQRHFTNFAAGLTGMPLPWAWDVRLPVRIGS
ncbi:MAG: hypothetical protein AB1716_11055 [Planctomycetota bacterium]